MPNPVDKLFENLITTEGAIMTSGIVLLYPPDHSRDGYRSDICSQLTYDRLPWITNLEAVLYIHPRIPLITNYLVSELLFSTL